MKRIAVLFGGKSCEHDISVITAVQAINGIDAAEYAVLPVYIDTEGNFFTGGNFDRIETFRKFVGKAAAAVHFRPNSSYLYRGKRKLAYIDCALLCMHGLNGEDGTLQGMLELSGIPYTSPGVLASAVSMDKIAAKLFLNGLGVKTVPWAWFDKAEFQTVDGYKKILASVEKLKYPIIVKPSNLGSSIGISVCRNRTELCAALDVALEFDNRILCERALKDITEINCSVLGFANEAAASQCEQPIKWQEVLSFSDKYLKGGKNKGMSAMTRKLPAPIEDEKALYIRETSQKIFLALAAKGVIRIDFIIDGGGQIFVNEINTIPGSLSGYLWEHEGMTFGELIGKLIEYAEADRARKKCLNYAYESNVLNNAGGAKL